MNASIQKQVLFALNEPPQISWTVATQFGELSQSIICETLPEALDAVETYFSQIPDPA
jgi:hypothetical protein